MRLHLDAGAWQGDWIDAKALREGGLGDNGESHLVKLLTVARTGQPNAPMALKTAAAELNHRWSVIAADAVAFKRQFGLARVAPIATV